MPNARYRSQVVPDSPAPAVSTAPDASAPSIYPHRFTWAALLARVFAVDVTVCPACGGPLRLIAVLSDPGLRTAQPAAPTDRVGLCRLTHDATLHYPSACPIGRRIPRSLPTPAPFEGKSPFFCPAVHYLLKKAPPKRMLCRKQAEPRPNGLDPTH